MQKSRQDDDAAEVQHDDKLVVLFERLLQYGERRFGITAQRATELLRMLHEREEQLKTIVRGFWVSAIGLILTALATLLVLGAKGWLWK